MAEAVLRIATAGGEELRRVLGQARASARAESDGVARESRRGAGEAARAERERTRVALREAAARRRAEEASAALVARAQRDATRIVERESARKLRVVEAEVRRTEALVRARLAASESAERAHTRAHAVESARRVAQAQREATAEIAAAARAERGRVAAGGRDGAGVLRTVGGAAASYAAGMHGQIASATERRAMSQRSLGQTLYQVGANAGDVRAAMSQITTFAGNENMDSGEIIAGLAGAQGQFSNLDGPGSLQQRIAGALQTASLARDTGNDVGEMLRLQGMLSQQHVDPAMQRQLMLHAAGAAQHGALELGDMTQASMGAITRRMNLASAGLGAGATAEQRDAAQRGAFVQSIAELQVARGFGNNAGQAGNALASLSGALTGDRAQGAMLHNIRASRELTADQRTRLEASLYEDDPNRRGHRRLRTTNALEVAERFSNVAGDNPALLNNVFAGSGGGNRQGLQANWRQLMGVMVSQDASGVTGADRIHRLMDPRTALTEQRVREGHEIFKNDPQAVATGARERGDNALTDNTSGLVRLSQTITNWQLANPWANGAVGTVGGAVGAAAAGRAATAVGGAAAAAGGASMGAMVAGGAAALGAGVIAGEGFNRRFQLGNGGRRDEQAFGAGNAPTIMNANTWSDAGREIADAIHRMFESSPPRVEISAQSAAHAASVAGTANGGRP